MRTNLRLYVICRSVDLKLSIKIPLWGLIANDIKVDGVIVNHWTFPSQQNGSVLLAGEIRDGWRRWSSNISSLKERRRRVSIVPGRDRNHDDFVFRERSWNEWKIVDYALKLKSSVLTQLLQRVIVNAGFTAHPILGVVLRHCQMSLIEWGVINAIDEVRSVRLFGLVPRYLDGWRCHLMYGHVAGMRWNCSGDKQVYYNKPDE